MQRLCRFLNKNAIDKKGDNMLCLLVCKNVDLASQWRQQTIQKEALPKCKEETQHGNYNLCRDGCPQGNLFCMLL